MMAVLWARFDRLEVGDKRLFVRREQRRQALVRQALAGRRLQLGRHQGLGAQASRTGAKSCPMAWLALALSPRPSALTSPASSVPASRAIRRIVRLKSPREVKSARVAPEGTARPNAVVQQAFQAEALTEQNFETVAHCPRVSASTTSAATRGSTADSTLLMTLQLRPCALASYMARSAPSITASS